MAAEGGPNIVEDGLVLYLDAASIKSYPGSGTTWSDLSGNGNDGTLSNGPTYSSTNLGSIVFDGSNDYINTTLTSTISDVTVVCWYKGTKTARNHLWNFGVYGDTTNLSFNFNDAYDLWVYWEGGGTNRVRYNIDGSFTDSTIKCAVFTHSGTTNKVYLNGVELTITESGGTQSFSNVNGTGSFKLGDDRYFGGNIYNCLVYNRALTASEVFQNYNATKGRFGL